MLPAHGSHIQSGKELGGETSSLVVVIAVQYCRNFFARTVPASASKPSISLNQKAMAAMTRIMRQTCAQNDSAFISAFCAPDHNHFDGTARHRAQKRGHARLAANPAEISQNDKG